MKCDDPDDLAIRRFLAGLRARRDRLGLSLRDVQRATGIDQSALSRLERGRLSNPTIRTVMRLARALGTPIDLPGPADGR